MKNIDNNSIDGVICDPPYFINFMAKEWDDFKRISFYEDLMFLVNNSYWPVDIIEGFFYYWGKECLRVMKPGAHLMAFSSPRSYHRMTSGLEKAGFEIRDCMIPWIYKSGMIKGTNISKAIDKRLGAKRKVVGQKRMTGSASLSINEKKGTYAVGAGTAIPRTIDVTVSNTESGKKWEGYGTHVAPAYEPIVLAVKPRSENLADNAIKVGIAGINLKDCEVSGRKPKNVLFHHHPDCLPIGRQTILGPDGGMSNPQEIEIEVFDCHPDCVVAEMNRQMKDETARFFYCKKANKSEKEKGLHTIAPKKVNDGRKTYMDMAYQRGESLRRNIHPTVKPIKLLRYLCRLIRQPDNRLILDPFMGSGSLGIAALQENMEYIGIELVDEYYEIAKMRISDQVNNGNSQLSINF